MNLYRLTRTDTGACLLVCAKSPVNARKLAANKCGEQWASSTVTKVQQFKAGKVERVMLGPLVESHEVLESTDNDEVDVPTDTMPTLEQTIDGALWHLGQWIKGNPAMVRDLLGKIGL